MAKRKIRTNSAPARILKSRKRKISREQIRTAARKLAERAAELDALAAAMHALDPADIEIDGLGLWDRGVRDLNRFIDNVHKGVSQAKRDRSSL